MTTETPTRLRCLVLGGGAVVAEFYLPAFAALGWLDDLWVADPSARALSRLTAAYPNLNTLQVDFQAALGGARDLGIQAVLVALPNGLHESAVALALERGFDVLCEKPLALTGSACRRLADTAAKSGRILGVGMTRRFLPAVKALRLVLDAGWIGDIQSVDVEDGYDFTWSSESGLYGRPDNGGVLANLGVHVLDLVEHLCGPLTPVDYTDDWHGGVEANATYALETSAGAPVGLSFSYTHSLTQGLKIRGTRGEARLRADASTVSYRAAGHKLIAEVSAETAFRFGHWPLTVEGSFREEFCDFTDSVAKRSAPTATARDAVRTAALIDWAYSHHDAGRLFVPASAGPSAPPLEPGRIVITGGTGFVGGHLTQALCDRGHTDILVPVRGYQRGANAWRFPVQLQKADLLDPRGLRDLFRGSRYVFHLAYGRDGDNATRVTTEGTQNVVEAAIAAGTECVVVLSTTAVFGDPGGFHPVDETFPYAHCKREYETAKAAAERWALARARHEARTRIVVINPACIYGPSGKTFTELPARMLRDSGFCWIEDGRGIMNYVYVTNLVDAILLAAARPNAHGERFIVSDGSTTWREFFTELFGCAVRDLPSYTRADLAASERANMPSLRDVARTIVGSEELWSLVRQNPQLAGTKAILERVTPKLYQRVKNSKRRSSRGQSDRPQLRRPPLFLDELFGATATRVSAAKAHRELAWQPRVNLAAGQAASRAWLVRIGLFDDASFRPAAMS